MEISYVLAKIIGLFLILVHGGFLLSGKANKKFFTDMMKETNLMYITGVFTVIIGIILVTLHNIWVRDRTLIITIFSWVALLKGLSIIIIPEPFMNISSSLLTNNTLLKILFLCVILVGVFLVAKGFMMF